MILDEETAYVRNYLKATLLERKVKGVSRTIASSVLCRNTVFKDDCHQVCDVATPFLKMIVFWDFAPCYSSP
jgi:hypothetical protein